MVGWVGVVDLEVKGVWNAPQAYIPTVYIFLVPMTRSHGRYDLRCHDGRDRRTGYWMVPTNTNCAPYHAGSSTTYA